MIWQLRRLQPLGCALEWPADRIGNVRGLYVAASPARRPSALRGRLVGIFFPWPEITLPIELKRELYDMLSSDIARQLKRRKVSQDDVIEDFAASRKMRRATRRRRSQRD